MATYLGRREGRGHSLVTYYADDRAYEILDPQSSSDSESLARSSAS